MTKVAENFILDGFCHFFKLNGSLVLFECFAIKKGHPFPQVGEEGGSTLVAEFYGLHTKSHLNLNQSNYSCYLYFTSNHYVA